MKKKYNFNYVNISSVNGRQRNATVNTNNIAKYVYHSWRGKFSLVRGKSYKYKDK